ncbi:MAG: acyl-CoA-binding protein [Acidobacteriota bacterium]|nr:acyl-CoA-binding protein [Acidobacteriota bacterium]
MSLEQDFEAAATRSKQLPQQSNENLLKIYSLYKQAVKGDVSGPKPGMFDMVGKAKYDAWSKLAGMSQEEAKTQYIALIEKLESGS